MIFQNKAMMTLGVFIFMRTTIPYQSLNRSLNFRQASNKVIGALPKTQFIGKESETIEISGVLMPEITGGKMSITVLEQMAESGKPFPLIQGDFSILGWYVIENVKINSSEFFSDGSPRKIDFSMSLKRTDESFVAKMIGKGSDYVSGVVDSAMSGVSDALSGVADDVMGGLKNLSGEIGGTISDAMGSAGQAISGVVGDISDGVGGMFSSTTSAVADTTSSIGQEINSLVEATKSVGEKAIDVEKELTKLSVV